MASKVSQIVQHLSNHSSNSIRELFCADSEKPSHVADVDPTVLSPFQRALLVIDGTVTKFIEAYTLDTLSVHIINQSEETLRFSHKELKADIGTPVITRSVVLRGTTNNKLYVYASSLIVPGRLAPEMKAKLQTPGNSIGRILDSHKMEQYRELLWYGVETIDVPPQGFECHWPRLFLSRTYRVISNGLPTMIINERFPQHVAGNGISIGEDS